MKSMRSCLSAALAVILVSSSEAFAPGISATGKRSLGAHSNALEASDKPLTELCQITKEACDVVSPLLKGAFVNLNQFKH
jgi:hypothetical protein